jgi:hypothetical protein
VRAAVGDLLAEEQVGDDVEVLAEREVLTRPRTSPARTSRSTSFSASTAPKLFE